MNHFVNGSLGLCGNHSGNHGFSLRDTKFFKSIHNVYGLKIFISLEVDK